MYVTWFSESIKYLFFTIENFLLQHGLMVGIWTSTSVQEHLVTNFMLISDEGRLIQVGVWQT
jgi:hypothetical protein